LLEIVAVGLDIAVLLSIGRHPASGRSRRAENDARALELALNLGGRTHAIHAGDPDEPALRDYLGMGLETLSVLRQPAECDVVPALVRHLTLIRPTLILTGSAAEQGPGSGMLPYLLARQLDLPLLPATAGLALNGGLLDALQALPRGRRRQLRAELPAVVAVDRAAPAARQSAYARARRGAIDVIDMAAGPIVPADAREVAARPRPRRLKVMSAATAAERLRAATEMQAGRGKLMVDPPADEAARAILDYLVSEGILIGH
jgi:electron transfer flavoprotein beta subunit